MVGEISLPSPDRAENAYWPDGHASFIPHLATERKRTTFQS